MNTTRDPLTQAPDVANTVDVIADALNLAFMFQGTATELLVKIARGDINLAAAAKAELAMRGLKIRKKKTRGRRRKLRDGSS